MYRKLLSSFHGYRIPYYTQLGMVTRRYPNLPNPEDRLCTVTRASNTDAADEDRILWDCREPTTCYKRSVVVSKNKNYIHYPLVCRYNVQYTLNIHMCICVR